jgi:hypothetical protein
MAEEDRTRREDTREFLAAWSDMVEGRLVAQLAPALSALLAAGEIGDAGRVGVLARHVVRAIRLAAESGDVPAAVRALQDAASAESREA